MSETDILIVLTGYLKNNKYRLDGDAIRYSDIDDKLNLPLGSTKKYIKQVVEEIGSYIPQQEGEKYIRFIEF